jgi:hypothetical protein
MALPEVGWDIVADEPQLRLKSASDPSKYVEFEVDAVGDLYVMLALPGGSIQMPQLTIDVDQIAGDVPWEKVSKAGSSLAHLETRSAGALNTGTLHPDRLVGAYTGITQVGVLESLSVSGGVASVYGGDSTTPTLTLRATIYPIVDLISEHGTAYNWRIAGVYNSATHLELLSGTAVGGAPTTSRIAINAVTGNVSIGAGFDPPAKLTVGGNVTLTGTLGTVGSPVSEVHAVTLKLGSTTSYMLSASHPSASDAFIFIAGMSGVSNGFRVQRVSGAMQYSFSDGDVSISGGILTIGTLASGTHGLAIVGNDQSNTRLRLSNVGTGGKIISLVAGNPGLSNDGFTVFNETNSVAMFRVASDGSSNPTHIFVGDALRVVSRESGTGYLIAT